MRAKTSCFPKPQNPCGLNGFLHHLKGQGYRDCGIMRPIPALLSKARGRFQGRPLTSEPASGGTGFLFFGVVVDSQAAVEAIRVTRTSFAKMEQYFMRRQG